MSKYTLFGTHIDGISSIKDAMTKAGLDHRVDKVNIAQIQKVRKLLERSSSIEDALDNLDTLAMKRFFSTVRSDTNEELGIVGTKFNICQNSVMEKLQPLVDSGKLKLKTAGALGFGERVFICGEVVGQQMKVSDDYKVTANILFSNSHDGSAAVRAGFSPIVPICSNTLAMAHRHKHSQLIRIYHGQSVNDNVNDIFDIINVAATSFEATFEQYQKLLDSNINQSDLETYVIKTMEWEKEPKADWSTRRSNQFDKILNLVKTAPGAASFQGTVFAAYNGLNTYLNHEAGNQPKSRANSIWFGKNRSIDNKSLENALELVQ